MSVPGSRISWLFLHFFEKLFPKRVAVLMQCAWCCEFNNQKILPVEKLEDLVEDLLDFSQVADLVAWSN